MPSARRRPSRESGEPLRAQSVMNLEKAVNHGDTADTARIKSLLTTATLWSRRKTKNLFLLLLLAGTKVSPWLMFLNLFFAGIKVSPWWK
jgi:hypothetical protein